jgi:hypothetical protein
MTPRLLNKVIRFDLLDAYKTENTNNLFFKYKENSKQSSIYGSGILIEKAVDINILWISKTFIYKIQDYYTAAGETDGFDNLDYIIQDLTNFFNSENEFLISQNSQETWNPNKLNFQDYQIKIVDDYAAYCWDKINPELILCSE